MVTTWSNAHLNQPLDVRHMGDVSEGVGVRHRRAVDEGHVVEVRVEMDDVERVTESPDDGVRDGMVAPQHDRGTPSRQRPGHQGGDVVEGARHIGRNDVGVAQIDDALLAHLPVEEPTANRWVEVSRLPGDESKGVLPDRPWAEARPGHERRPFIGRGAEDDQFGLDRIFGPEHRGAQERRDPHERHVHPTRCVCHG
jgi:hypothetical protein